MWKRIRKGYKGHVKNTILYREELLSLQEQFEKETGKKAIHCGNMTKAFKEWKANQ